MSNYNETQDSFGAKLKRICANRAVVITFLTMLVAVAVVIAVTVSANRSKKPSTDPTESGMIVQPTDTSSNPSGVGQETLPTYHGQETKPVINEQPDEPSLFELPVSGKLFKDHDATMQVYSATMGDYRVHLGLDIVTEANAPVFAAADGQIEKVWDDALMGTCVAISHSNDILTVYKNLAVDLAKDITEGAKVKCGQQIGTVGDTAILEMADEPHLHFEMTAKGLSVDPMDYFDKDSADALSKDTAFEQNAVTSAGK
ncbi:MAG: M23 family metallopeptidase [Ruminococcaceae bacterium]|nr:M23 family metallopeptidase [Oscillospiraceae bacterium]